MPLKRAKPAVYGQMITHLAEQDEPIVVHGC